MLLEPGLFLFQGLLTSEAQQHLWRACRGLADGPVPMYTPTVRGGRKMSVGMLCLGRHWNGLTYTYEPARSDFDNQPAPPIPDSFRRLATEIAAAADMPLDADICILNYYDATGR